MEGSMSSLKSKIRKKKIQDWEGGREGASGCIVGVQPLIGKEKKKIMT